MGFLVAGGTAFVADAGTLMLLAYAGLPLLAGRMASIAVAMVVAWWLNRTLTFRVAAAPTWAEFSKYALLAATTAILNYVIFALLVTTHTVTHPLAATALATLASMAVSFMGMKRGVFRQPKA